MSHRTVRSTTDLVMWVFGQLNPGLRTETWHLAPVPYALVESLVRAVLDTGRRVGRAELARELFDRMGLGDELGPPPVPAMSVDRELAAPRELPRELAAAVPISPSESRTKRIRKP